jgi:hypothetical protein
MLSRIQLALSNGSPVDALPAAISLKMCAQVLKLAERETRAGIRGMPENQARQMLSEDGRKLFDSMPTAPRTNEQGSFFETTYRECQALDAHTLSKQGELLARAFRGGVPDSAEPYLSWLIRDAPNGREDNTLLAHVRAEVARAAENGQILTLQTFLTGSQSMALEEGFTVIQHAAYREAYLLIMEENGPGSSIPLRQSAAIGDQISPPKVQLTEQEKAEATAQAEKILANVRSKRKG